ncbi:FAD-dependent oxidoreductase, partial [uncultured Salegentibacter sp.]
MGFEHFDVFVIGTGTAGKGVAKDCAKAGWKVAIADNREYGGTCPNRGCDPK